MIGGCATAPVVSRPKILNIKNTVKHYKVWTNSFSSMYKVTAYI